MVKENKLEACTLGLSIARFIKNSCDCLVCAPFLASGTYICPDPFSKKSILTGPSSPEICVNANFLYLAFSPGEMF
jgi:hypothetical protein